MLVMLANKHTRNVCLLSAPSDHMARGVLPQDALTRTPLWSTMMKPYPSANGHWDPKQADGNYSGRLAVSPQVSICPPPLLGHHLMVTSLLGLSEVIIWLMKDGNGKTTFELGPINKTPRQDSLVPSFPCKQTPRKPTPGPSGTRWSEELFREPSQTKEPPIPGPSPSSQPHEDNTTCEPECEVAPTQYTEEPFGKSPFLFLQSSQLSLTFSSTISSLSRHSPLHNYHQRYARWIPPPPPRLPHLPILFPPLHSNPGSLPVHPRTPTPPLPWCKAPLIHTMTLARNLPTYNQLR
ncbi:hypothetical protein O181_076762 [Austropuccinia psidii MF-1]|uniref:Uncharacterized protein n=1 Tax=Austropuccinia psidii MF-1 TaxID=1389203 RepID=A0A9Q3FHH6_9BASI|nr:hypothetical protein [Austropuccinia psidii MF-1]